jgi:16S rRNA G966 N2-methylase RsmD
MEKNILNKIFPPSENIKNLGYDGEGLWSITLPQDADTISQIILNENNSNITIIDSTAGLGGNTLSFAKYFKNVIAIELNKERFTLLQNNIKAYDYTNINCINDDCIVYINNNIVTSNIVYFFDPPWGGPDYKNSSKIRIKLGNTNLYDIIKKLKDNNSNIFIKLPNNYDLDEFVSFNYRVNKIKNYMLLIL